MLTASVRSGGGRLAFGGGSSAGEVAGEKETGWGARVLLRVACSRPSARPNLLPSTPASHNQDLLALP